MEENAKKTEQEIMEEMWADPMMQEDYINYICLQYVLYQSINQKEKFDYKREMENLQDIHYFTKALYTLRWNVISTQEVRRKIDVTKTTVEEYDALIQEDMKRRYKEVGKMQKLHKGIKK